VGLVTPQVPADGFVIFALNCPYGCDPVPDPMVVVRDPATGGEVPGALAPVADVPESLRAFGWRATSPLAAGSFEIEIQLGGSNAPIPTTFQAVAPVEAEIEAVAVTPTIATYDAYVGETTCCPSGPLDSCGGNFCWYSTRQRLITMSVSWSSPSAPAHFGQYLYRTTWDGREPEPWQLARGSSGSNASFDTPEPEYCYTFELKSLLDGSISTVERRCLPHPPDAELGAFDVEPEEIRNNLARCDEPPAGHESAWCEARAAYCAEFELTQCSALETHCAGTGDPGDDRRSGARTIRTEGCAVVRPAGRPSPGLWAAMLFSAAIGAGLLRRRAPFQRVRER
jgi:hypothetical protein